jgi:hypothetical protein
MIKGKKGEDVGFDAVIILPIIFFIIFVFLSYVFFTNAFFKTNVGSAEAESKIYAERLLYAKECLAYYDGREIKRVYPGIIDITKFTTERLEGCMNFTKEERAALKAELLYNGDKTEIFYNKDRFEMWDKLAGISGSGSFEKYNITTPVSVIENGEMSGAQISITVIIPKNR